MPESPPVMIATLSCNLPAARYSSPSYSGRGFIFDSRPGFFWCCGGSRLPVCSLRVPIFCYLDHTIIYYKGLTFVSSSFFDRRLFSCVRLSYRLCGHLFWRMLFWFSCRDRCRISCRRLCFCSRLPRLASLHFSY